MRPLLTKDKNLYKKTNLKKVGFSTMAFTTKILSWRFRHQNIVVCLLKRRPTKGGGGGGGGGVTGTPGPPPPPPPSYALAIVSLNRIFGVEYIDISFDPSLLQNLLFLFKQVQQANIDDEEIARAINSKLGETPGISYSEIASNTVDCGRTHLAIKVS